MLKILDYLTLIKSLYSGILAIILYDLFFHDPANQQFFVYGAIAALLALIGGLFTHRPSLNIGTALFSLLAVPISFLILFVLLELPFKLILLDLAIVEVSVVLTSLIIYSIGKQFERLFTKKGNEQKDSGKQLIAFSLIVTILITLVLVVVKDTIEVLTKGSPTLMIVMAISLGISAIQKTATLWKNMGKTISGKRYLHLALHIVIYLVICSIYYLSTFR